MGLALTTVAISFFYSRGELPPTPAAGYVASVLALLPLALLPLPGGATVHAKGNPSALGAPLLAADEGVTPAPAADAAPQLAKRGSGRRRSDVVSTPTVGGLSFKQAASGLDFWLLWFIQFAVFGSGVATNQNLALILESAEAPAASGLGVALFGLAHRTHPCIVATARAVGVPRASPTVLPCDHFEMWAALAAATP